MTHRYTGWRKAKRSDPRDTCVEVGRSNLGTVAVRDSKAGPYGPVLDFTPAEWSTFLRTLR